MAEQQHKDQEITDALSAFSEAFPEARALAILHDRLMSGPESWSGIKLLAPAPRRSHRAKACSHFSSSDELCEDTPCERCGEPFVEWAQ